MLCLLVKGTITVEIGAITAFEQKSDKEVILKNCTPFTNCISEINTTQ